MQSPPPRDPGGVNPREAPKRPQRAVHGDSGRLVLLELLADQIQFEDQRDRRREVLWPEAVLDQGPNSRAVPPRTRGVGSSRAKSTPIDVTVPLPLRRELRSWGARAMRLHNGNRAQPAPPTVA